MLSEKNTTSSKQHTVNHCCGSKPFVRYREELKDQVTQEQPGRITMYQHTRFNQKKGRWVSPEAEEIYNAMNVLNSTPVPPNSTPLTEDQVYDKVLGARPGYVRGLGHGEDPLPASALNELEYIEEARRNALDAERRVEEAERLAQEAQLRFEESERRREESERKTDEKLQAMQAQMTNFMAMFNPTNFTDLLMRGA